MEINIIYDTEQRQRRGKDLKFSFIPLFNKSRIPTKKQMIYYGWYKIYTVMWLWFEFELTLIRPVR